MAERLLTFSLYSAAAGAAAYGLGAGLAIAFSSGHGGRYGSNFHRFMHYLGKTGGGRIAHVRCVDVANKRHVNVFGLVCKDCGFVNVNRVLDEDEPVETEIFDRHPGEFCWTMLEQTAEGAQAKVKV